MVFIAYWHYETEQPSPLPGYLWYWRSHQKYCVPVIHESVLPHISTAETQKNITGMPHYLYRYLLKQGSEGIHRNGLIGILQDHILKQVKYVIGKSTDQKIHLVCSELFMRYPSTVKVILEFFGEILRSSTELIEMHSIFWHDIFIVCNDAVY